MPTSCSPSIAVDEAIAEYRKAIAIIPKYADACNNLGTVLADCGELDAAVAQFRRGDRDRAALASATAIWAWP